MLGQIDPRIAPQSSCRHRSRGRLRSPWLPLFLKARASNRSMRGFSQCFNEVSNHGELAWETGRRKFHSRKGVKFFPFWVPKAWHIDYRRAFGLFETQDVLRILHVCRSSSLPVPERPSTSMRPSSSTYLCLYLTPNSSKIRIGAPIL